MAGEQHDQPAWAPHHAASSFAQRRLGGQERVISGVGKEQSGSKTSSRGAAVGLAKRGGHQSWTLELATRAGHQAWTTWGLGETVPRPESSSFPPRRLEADSRLPSPAGSPQISLCSRGWKTEENGEATGFFEKSGSEWLKELVWDRGQLPWKACLRSTPSLADGGTEDVARCVARDGLPVFFVSTGVI